MQDSLNRTLYSYGADFSHVVKVIRIAMASNVLFLLLFQVTVYVTDIDAISDVKKICAKYFVEPFPARWNIFFSFLKTFLGYLILLCYLSIRGYEGDALINCFDTIQHTAQIQFDFSQPGLLWGWRLFHLTAQCRQ